MAVADERREGCDGCGRTVALKELTTVTMPDGERMACCPSCEPHAREVADKLAALEESRGTCDGCTTTFPKSELEDVVLTDGTVVTCCPDCLSEVPGTDETTTESAETTETAETTEIATRKNLCSQCHEWVTEELYHVTTIDGRTEEMCEDCKYLSEQKGVVNNVKMRRGEAREILRVDADATQQEIRQAFLTHVKHAHPDKKGGSESAFKLIKEAYDRLR